MKISICIPQFNRIQFLLKNLQNIAIQTYSDIEVVISDDCSTDETELEINKLRQTYKYQLIYKRNENNLGYDRNLRQSMELSSGMYCFILGNDDSINDASDIAFLVNFLQNNKLPDLGFCNYVEEKDKSIVFERAVTTGILGTGYELALKQCSNFSFVAGLIYKRDVFLKYNTDRFDGSVYVQMYLSCLMIASGCRLFTINKPLVIKDIQVGREIRNSYVDKIARKWMDLRIVDGGLPSVIKVLVSAFEDAGVISQRILYKIFFRIYSTTYPHWLLDYRSHDALPEAFGLVRGLNPNRNGLYIRLKVVNRIRIYSLYIVTTIMGLFIPVKLFTKYKPRIYQWLRKKLRN